MRPRGYAAGSSFGGDRDADAVTCGVFGEADRPGYHERLALQIAERAPNVLALWAPAGYKKRTLLNGFARRYGALSACELDPRRDRDPARSVLDAVVAGSPARAARSSADLLASRGDRAFGTARDALRREWPYTEGRELLVVRDAGGVLSTPAGAELLAELIATRPADRTIALTTRAPLPPALQQLADSGGGETLGPLDLALSAEALGRLAAAGGIAEDAAEAVHGLTDGWPLVSELLLLLVRLEGRDAALRDIATLPRPGLLTFAGRRVVGALDERLRETVAAAVVRPGATADELMRVLGDRSDDTVLLRFSTLPFVTMENDRGFVHPEIAALLRSRYAPLVDALYQQTIAALVADGAHGAAARVALENRDALRAAALLDAAPPYTQSPLGLTDYERVLDRIDRAVVTGYPNMWLATIPFRRFSVDRETYLHEAETVYYCLPYSAAPEKRVAALMHLASAYFNHGRVADCDAIIEAALQGFGSSPSPARASLLNFSAVLRGEQGRFSEARALGREGAALSNQPFDENLALHHIEANEAIMRGRYNRIKVIFEELLRRQSRDELPLYYAYSATDGAFWAWAYGDDATFTRLLAALEDALTPGLEPGFAQMIDAARGRPIADADAYAWPVHSAMAQLYRLAHATGRNEALEAARYAALHADERRDPMLQVLAHTALYVLDEADRAAQGQVLEALAASVESPELQAAVHGLLAGEGAGILEAFVSRRIVADRKKAPPKVAVELFAARVSHGAKQRRISGKELELLALLATSYGPISRDRIGEALWDYLDPEEWPNNLKVTLFRLRAKLGDRNAIEVTDGNYRLSREVDVDVRRYESAVRESQGTVLDERRRAALREIMDAYASGATGAYERLAGMQGTLTRINDVVCAAGLALSANALAALRYDEALDFAHAVTAVDPLNEAACEMVMKIDVARGDTDAARRELRRYATVLAAELGGTPSPHLAEIVHTV